MTRQKLDKLKRELSQMRRSPQRAADLESLARRLGRKRSNRGKHPMWENQEFPELYALSIPAHGSKDLPPGTRNSILNQLEDDVLAWEVTFPPEEDDENNDTSSNGEDHGAGTDTD
jgi:hypothetical protein